MIYEISVNDIPTALATGARLIIISADSSLALVASEIPLECIQTYAGEELDALLLDSKWRQPCKDCEI